MDEDMMNFFHYNMNTVPDCMQDAAKYVVQLIRIAYKNNPESYNDLKRIVRNMNTISKERLKGDCYPEEMSRKIESDLFQNKKIAQWSAKVARYLAYLVNGGLLQSKFTLNTLLRQLGNMDSTNEEIIKNEILYLLHVRKKDGTYDRANIQFKQITSALGALT